MCNSNKITICTEFDAAQIAGLQVPIASIHAFATQSVPDGYLICDGAAISRTEYAELFAALGTVWGAGDEVATFNIPDLRGEFMRGFDAGRGVDVGRVFGSAQASNVGDHKHQTHIQWASGFPHYIYWDNPNAEFGLGDAHLGAIDHWVAGDNDSTVSTQYRLTDNPYNGTDGGNTRPRNIAITYAIKASNPTPA
ncbi:phage tail protein [Thalassospira sp.]|uniref:phage tail protein n=1 Tax=Thalassospira sp. TaxID=1912094 RepID=UPI0032ECBCE7